MPRAFLLRHVSQTRPEKVAQIDFLAGALDRIGDASVELHRNLTRDLHWNFTRPMGHSMAHVIAGFLVFTSLLPLVELFLKR